jgi:hypothetical protein
MDVSNALRAQDPSRYELLTLQSQLEDGGTLSVSAASPLASTSGVRSPNGANRVRVFAEDQSGLGTLGGTVTFLVTCDNFPTGNGGVTQAVRTMAITSGTVGLANPVTLPPGVTSVRAEVERTAGDGTVVVVFAFWRER